MSTKDGQGPPSGAERMRLHRKRHRRGTRCVRLQLHVSVVDYLVRKRLLTNSERDDPQALRDAVLVLISMCVEGWRDMSHRPRARAGGLQDVPPWAGLETGGFALDPEYKSLRCGEI
jgi:hypothetical protein